MMPTIDGFRKSNPTTPHIERAWFQGFMPKTLKSVEKAQ
jgi:hypothetical protein